MATHLICAILPDARVAEQAILLSKNLDREAGGSKIVLSADRNPPHLSLFHFMVDERSTVLGHATDPEAGEGKVRLIADHLGKLLKRAPPIEVRLARLEEASPGWIFWNAERDVELEKLHVLVAGTLGVLRDGDVPITWAKHMNADQRDAYEKCGYPNAMKAFDPHITLGRVRPEGVNESYKSGMPFAMSFEASSLVICEIGKNATLGDVRAEIPLGG